MRREDSAGDNDAGDFDRAADIVLFFVVAQARAVDELANIPDKFAGNRLAGQRHVIEIDSQQAALLFAVAVERAQVRMDGSTMASVLRAISFPLASVLTFTSPTCSSRSSTTIPIAPSTICSPGPTPAQNPQSRGSKCRLY